MNVSVQLDQPIVVRLMRKEKVVDGEKLATKKNIEGVCVYVYMCACIRMGVSDCGCVFIGGGLL